MVEQIGLSYLYLSKRGGVPRMCVGAVIDTRTSTDLQRGGSPTLAQLWALPGILGHRGTTGSQ